MLKIIHAVFDTLFPPRESERLIHDMRASDVLSLYKPHIFQDVISLVPYQHPVVKALVKENKFHQNRSAASLLSKLIEHWLMLYTRQNVLLVPIPLGKKRQRERGYNQVTQILQSVHLPGVSIEAKLLTRNRETQAQTELTREARLKNITGAFVCNQEMAATLRQTTIVLVDDVLTTGATLTAARASLAPNLHPSNTLICLAVTH